MFSIQQLSDTEWQVLDADGAQLGDLHATYAEALAFIGGMLAVLRNATLAEQPDDTEPEQGAEAGLLPEPWESVDGICFSEPTGDGRDFTECTWSGRDPNVSLLPLMLQTSTDFGHFGAVLAGYFTELDNLGAGTNPTAAGRFYDSEAGRQFRDMLLGGRRFGVSVDPGRVSGDWVCTAEDEDGFCVAEEYSFTEYEVIGLTGTPFPAFARAAIQLGSGVQASAAPWGGAAVGVVVPDTAAELTTYVVASAVDGGRSLVPQVVARERFATMASVLVASAATAVGYDLAHPPAEWLATDEPELGQSFALGSLGDEWLVDQGQGRLAMPLTITNDGRVAGHLAVWGQCHTGYPGQCVSPPDSPSAYAHFHVGEVVCADGSRVPTGALTAGCDHAVARLRAPEARDHYAHNGLPWASVRVSNGVFGPWVCGALRPDVTEAQLAVLRGGALSGDWRRIGNGLELIAALAVGTPGFPIAREAVTASGLRMLPDAPRTATSMEAGVQQSLVASGLVRRCPDCQRRAAEQVAGMRPGQVGPVPADPEVVGLLRTLERRTRHLAAAEAQHRLAQLQR